MRCELKSYSSFRGIQLYSANKQPAMNSGVLWVTDVLYNMHTWTEIRVLTSYTNHPSKNLVHRKIKQLISLNSEKDPL